VPPVPAELEERSRRIVDTAVELAEKGGFEAVRLRDVASHAGVALGTLYRRFRSKEDLLIAALELETRELERRVVQRPPQGSSAVERVSAFFSTATRGMCRRPNLARALLKAVASGEPELAQQVGGFHDRMKRLIVLSLRGSVPTVAGSDAIDGVDGLDGLNATDDERRLADVLNSIWFAKLVGWSGGLHGQNAVVEQMRSATELVLAEIDS